AKTGLVVKSRKGDLALPPPPTVAADAIKAPFDLVLVSCKAFDLPAAIDSFAPAVGPSTAILPLLNGIGHLDTLAARFGKAAVMGGQCAISTVLDGEGRVLHLNDIHLLTFGELDGTRSVRATAIAADLANAGFDGGLSEAILQEMWEKWVFIATAAGITCLMRAAVGDIVAAGATELTLALFEEISTIAAGQGFALRPAAAERGRAMLTQANSPFTASMLRDIEGGRPIEADHMLGDLLKRGGERPGGYPLLGVAYAHLKAYEARRAREGKS
ncbi:MAG: ketopantoate reductase family protein, partial [Reyranella sp.]